MSCKCNRIFFPMKSGTLQEIGHFSFRAVTCTVSLSCCVCLLFLMPDCQPHDREPWERAQPPKHDLELSSLTAANQPIRKRLMGIHGPEYLAVTSSAWDEEAATLRCHSLWLSYAARGKSKHWLHSAAHCGLGLTDLVVSIDWHWNGNGENLQFLLFYVKQASQTVNQGFGFTVGKPSNVDATVQQPPIALFIGLFQIYCSPCQTLRDTKTILTLMSPSALVETLITALLSVGLVSQPQVGQKWLMFKQ